MVVGTDTTHGTTHSTTTLASPIGTGNGTKPSSQSGTTSSPAAGQWQVQWISTWNVGIVSGTLGEVGLYLYAGNTLIAFQGGGGATTSFFSRMASAPPDNKFVAFAINSSVPLSIAWTFLLTYVT